MVKVISQQSMENREYVRRLLKQKQPGFSAALELAMDLVGRELRSAGMHDDRGRSWPPRSQEARCSGRTFTASPVRSCTPTGG